MMDSREASRDRVLPLASNHWSILLSNTFEGVLRAGCTDAGHDDEDPY